MRQIELDIIIVNWDSGKQLHDCLSSIVKKKKDSNFTLNLYVIDNASSDNSLKQGISSNIHVEIIKNKSNRGFAYACNQGARLGHADYILFLNPDSILNEGSLSAPLSFLEDPNNSRIAIVGIQLVDSTGRISRTCSRFPTPVMFARQMLGLDQLAPRFFPSHLMREWDHQQSCGVDHVMGAFFMIRRSVFEALGGFDERFFVFLEDLDLSLRASRAGYGSYYLANVQEYHRGGGTSEQAKAHRLYYSLCSRILYGFKHFDRFAAVMLMLGTLSIEPFLRLALVLKHPSARYLCETVYGYLLLWRAVPSMLKTASRESSGL